MALIQCPDCKRDISDLATICIHCGRPSESHATVPAMAQTAALASESSAKPLSTPPAVTHNIIVEEYGAQYAFGWVLLIVGALGLAFSLTLDTSVGYGTYDRVNNLGLMNDKQNYLIASSVVTILGVILLVTAKKHRINSAPPDTVSRLRTKHAPVLSADEAKRKAAQAKEDEEHQNAEWRQMLGITGVLFGVIAAVALLGIFLK